MNLWSELKTIAMYGTITMVLMVVAVIVGCGAPAPGPASVAWPPAVDFESGQAAIYVDLSTPDGPARLNLDTGMVSGPGSDEVAVDGWGGQIATEVTVNGVPQTARVLFENTYEGDTWTHCLAGELGVMHTVISGRWPLSPDCGPSGVLGVTYSTPLVSGGDS